MAGPALDLLRYSPCRDAIPAKPKGVRLFRCRVNPTRFCWIGAERHVDVHSRLELSGSGLTAINVNFGELRDPHGLARLTFLYCNAVPGDGRNRRRLNHRRRSRLLFGSCKTNKWQKHSSGNKHSEKTAVFHIAISYRTELQVRQAAQSIRILLLPQSHSPVVRPD